MNRLPRFVSILLLALGLPAAATAGAPWTQPAGEGFFQLAAYEIGPYDSLYIDGDDRFRLSREVEDRTVEAYFEYGLNDRWTILASQPYKLLEAGSPAAAPTLTPSIDAGTLDRAGNLVIGARRKLRDGKLLVSTQLELELPTGEFDPATGLSSGHDAYTATPTLHVGKSWRKSYLSGYGGFALRTDDFSSDWRAGAEVGYELFGRLWLVGVADVVQSFENGDVALPVANLETGLYLNDQEYVAYGTKLLLDITKRVGLQFTRHSAVGGNNVARSALSGVGVWVRW